MIKRLLFLSVLTIPLAAEAVTFAELVTSTLAKIFRPTVYILLALAIIYFLAGVVKYLQAAGSEDKRKEGRQMMIYGVVALFVMISVWGLVNLLSATFNLDTDVPPYPKFLKN